MPEFFDIFDSSRLPKSLRSTLLEVLEECMTRYSDYNAWAAAEVVQFAREKGFTRIVEMGAGSARLTRTLAAMPETDGWEFAPCDLFPEERVYRELAALYPTKVFPCFSSVDIAAPYDAGPETLFVFSASIHQLPDVVRQNALARMQACPAGVLILEPIRRTWTSVAVSLTSFIPPLLLPLTRLGRPGSLRRFFWCWAFPAAPVMFQFDAMEVRFRIWSPERWRETLGALYGDGLDLRIKTTPQRMAVAWQAAPTPVAA